MNIETVTEVLKQGLPVRLDYPDGTFCTMVLEVGHGLVESPVAYHPAMLTLQSERRPELTAKLRRGLIISNLLRHSGAEHVTLEDAFELEPATTRPNLLTIQGGQVVQLGLFA